MERYASRFVLAFNLGRDNFYLLDWGDGRTGLYIRRPWFTNKFDTNLAASGTREEMENLVREFVNE